MSHLFRYLGVHSVIYLPPQLTIFHSFAHSFTHSHTHSLTHSFTHSPMLSLLLLSGSRQKRQQLSSKDLDTLTRSLTRVNMSTFEPMLPEAFDKRSSTFIANKRTAQRQRATQLIPSCQVSPSCDQCPCNDLLAAGGFGS